MACMSSFYLFIYIIVIFATLIRKHKSHLCLNHYRQGIYMKKLILVILAYIGLFVCASGQNLSVKSFYLAEKDLTAILPETKVLDQNNEVCALIKVESGLDGLTFDVGTLGVREVRYEVGEAWVYVPFGVRHITIKHPKLGIIRDYTFSVSIEKGRTYILKLDHPDVGGVFDSSKHQNVVIQVFPVDAKVEVNGITLKVDSEGKCMQELSYGMHEVLVSAERYYSTHERIQVNEQNSVFKIDLKPAFGWIQVSGSGNEKLYVDGKLVSMRPGGRVALDSGHYQIRVEKPLHKPYETNVEIKDNQVCQVAPHFVINYREIEFTVPGSAEIWIDDSKVGTGSWKGKVEYGRHRIECRKSGCRNTEMVMDVTPNSSQHVTLQTPVPITGILVVNTSPTMADVYVDGEPVGKSPATVQVTIGSRSVEVRKTGYHTETRKVDVKDGETSIVDIKMSNLVTINISANTKASVYIDGSYVGSTPLRQVVSSGRHKISLQAPRYLNLEKQIDAKENNKRYTFRMKRRFYNGRGFVLGAHALSGAEDLHAGGYIGLYINSFYMEGDFRYGLNDKESIYWNPNDMQNEPVECRYRPMSYGGAIGCGLVIGSRMKLTPLAGARYIVLKGESYDSYFTDSLYPSFSVYGGMKIHLALASFFELTLTPEYNYPVYQSDMYGALSNLSPMIKSYGEGFKVRVGLGFYF